MQPSGASSVATSASITAEVRIPRRCACCAAVWGSGIAESCTRSMLPAGSCDGLKRQVQHLSHHMLYKVMTLCRSTAACHRTSARRSGWRRSMHRCGPLPSPQEGSPQTRCRYGTDMCFRQSKMIRCFIQHSWSQKGKQTIVSVPFFYLFIYHFVYLRPPPEAPRRAVQPSTAS